MSNIEQELQKAVHNVQVPANISEQIQQEIKKAASRIDELIESERARAASNTSGSDSAAWDTVAELNTEASHQQTPAQPKSSLEKYCDEHPSASECLIYDD